MSYKSPAEFDRALKKAVRKAGGDPGEDYRQALRDRFLCRVFSDPDARYILKGGSGLLARIPGARSTRDLDFAARPSVSAEAALSEMKALAARDLGDFCRFELTRHEESLDENGYSRLLKLRFATYVGDQEKDPILIDLSLDCDPLFAPEHTQPLNRIEIEGVPSCEYLLYPLPDQLADKLCAVMERQPGGWPSSRMKDLADIVFYATGRCFDLRELALAVRTECRKRGMEVPESFSAPEEWRARFAPFAAKNRVPARYRGFDEAIELAGRFYAPALAGKGDMTWNPKALAWESAEEAAS